MLISVICFLLILLTLPFEMEHTRLQALANFGYLSLARFQQDHNK